MYMYVIILQKQARMHICKLLVSFGKLFEVQAIVS